MNAFVIPPSITATTGRPVSGYYGQFGTLSVETEWQITGGGQGVQCQGKLRQYLDKNNPKPNGDWAVGLGEVVVSALLAGRWPSEYKEDTIQMARMCVISSDPPSIFEIVEKLGK